MTASPPPIDIVTVATAVAVALFGQELAVVIGPYAVITLGALLGGAFSASRRESQTLGKSFGFMLSMVALSLLVTVPLAAMLAPYIGADQRWLLGPVAVIISGIGHDWPKVCGWAVDQTRQVIERWAAKRGQ